jgi:hypothetical protein
VGEGGGGNHIYRGGEWEGEWEGEGEGKEEGKEGRERANLSLH